MAPQTHQASIMGQLLALYTYDHPPSICVIYQQHLITQVRLVSTIQFDLPLIYSSVEYKAVLQLAAWNLHSHCLPTVICLSSWEVVVLFWISTLKTWCPWYQVKSVFFCCCIQLKRDIGAVLHRNPSVASVISSVHTKKCDCWCT